MINGNDYYIFVKRNVPLLIGARKLKGILVRVGIDQAYGSWNAPVDPISNNFFYMPIPEENCFYPGLEKRYKDFFIQLKSFADKYNRTIFKDLAFPKDLLSQNMHLDPDFDYLTYGDRLPRANNIIKLEEDDFIVFYAGLNPISSCKDKLIYALIGIYFIDELRYVKNIDIKERNINAHSRTINREEDIIVIAKQKISGRFCECIPIGEWRNKSYRVQNEVLDKWGDITVKDGFIQRSAVPPLFKNPEKFLTWLDDLEIKTVSNNNLL